MPTPAQRRIIHLLALAGGLATEAQVVELTGNNRNTINTHLCEMRRAGLINRGKGVVWLTMRGWNENNVPAAISDSTVAL